jgi:hypothetical protein
MIALAAQMITVLFAINRMFASLVGLCSLFGG